MSTPVETQGTPADRPLTEDEMRLAAPSVFAAVQHTGRSAGT